MELCGLSEAEQRFYITTRLQGLKEKIDFLDTLHSQRHSDEALLLCSCYIDGLAGVLYFPEQVESHRGFVRVVCEHGGDPFLPLVHPRQMLVALNRRQSWNAIRQSIGPFLQGTELVSESEFLASVKHLLDQGEFAKLESNIWRGTMASFAYRQLRSPVVHELGRMAGVSFAATTFRGSSVPLISFEVLRPVLRNIFAVASRFFMNQEELIRYLGLGLGT